MMSSAIEALYIYDQSNEVLLEHIYCSRPASAQTILPYYLALPRPRPSLFHIADVVPSTTVYSVTYSNLIFVSPTSREADPLFILEFIHRVIDVFEEFLGSPLLPNKIENNYDVISQLLGEMCDAGCVATTEPNALRDDVEVSGWVGKLLGGVGLPSVAPTPGGDFKQQMSTKLTSAGPAIPWRRANVRHTSNEIYVDIVENLVVTLAPSGLPLGAYAYGSILFTSKLSGTPDLVLTLSASGGSLGTERAIELPVFHPCVRLARWKERPGELSFVPPDGKCVLASYEVNLMPANFAADTWENVNLQLPLTIEVDKSLGTAGTEFEVRLLISAGFNNNFATSTTRPPLSERNSGRNSGRSTPHLGTGNSSGGLPLADISVHIPMPTAVRNVTELHASRGEAFFNPTTSLVEWRLLSKDVAVAGTITLRCTVIGSIIEKAEDEPEAMLTAPAEGDYDENEDGYQTDEPSSRPPTTAHQPSAPGRMENRIIQNACLMPTSASVSFSVKGWLASGIKVDKLIIDTKRSRGLGEGVKPYKGVKYLTVSRRGLETRC